MIDIESFNKIKNILIIEKFLELREEKMEAELTQKKSEIKKENLGLLKSFSALNKIKDEMKESYYDLENSINKDYENTLNNIKELSKLKLSRKEVEVLSVEERKKYENNMSNLSDMKKRVDGGILKFAIHEYIENESYAEKIKQRYPEIETEINSKIAEYTAKGKTPEESYALSFNMYLKAEKTSLAKELFKNAKSLFSNSQEKEEALMGLKAITTPAYASNPKGFVPRKALNGLLNTDTFLKISGKISTQVEKVFKDVGVDCRNKGDVAFKTVLLCLMFAQPVLMTRSTNNFIMEYRANLAQQQEAEEMRYSKRTEKNISLEEKINGTSNDKEESNLELPSKLKKTESASALGVELVMPKGFEVKNLSIETNKKLKL